MNRRLASIVVAVGIVPSATFGFLVWVVYADGLLTLNGHMLVVRDYLWLWAAGHLLAAGETAMIFDPRAFANWNRGIFGAQLDDFVWSYPPSLLFLALPAGYAPILPGFVLYAAAQLVLLGGIVRLARLPSPAWLAVLVSPAVLENVLGGQNGALTAALLCGGLLLTGRRPVISGILFGLLTIKPQLGLLVPVCLIASREWKAIAAACGTAAALFAISGVAFGFGSWVMFWENTRPYMTGIMQADWHGLFYQRIAVTPFMAVRSLGAGLPAAYICQLIATLAAIALTWRLWRQPTADPAPRVAATMCLALLATPYGYNYDMTGVAVAVAMLACAAVPLSPVEGTILVLAWLWPGVAFRASSVGLQPVVVLLIAGVVWIGLNRRHPGRLLV